MACRVSGFGKWEDLFFLLVMFASWIRGSASHHMLCVETLRTADILSTVAMRLGLMAWTFLISTLA